MRVIHIRDNKMIYIAAPFFNLLEVEVVEKIENRLTFHNQDIYSPRTQGALTPESVKDPEVRKKVNDTNLEKMVECDAAVAWIDRLLPENRFIGMFEWTGGSRSGDSFPDRYRGGSDPELISQRRGHAELVCELGCVPDQGVLVEVGFMKALAIPVYGFTLRNKGELNLMLSENLHGLLYGWDDMDRFAAHFNTLNPKGLTADGEWGGTFQ